MKKLQDIYLDENENYYKNLNEGLDIIDKIASCLYDNYEINIKIKPWFLNIMDIYIPQAIDFYENAKNENYNIDKESDIWMRSSYKSFLSEIEKFIKFFNETIIPKNPENFCSEITKLREICEKNKQWFDDSNKFEEFIYEITDVLHNWRKIQNENKHNHNHLDSCFYDKSRTRTIINSDVLSFVSDTIYRIIMPLLVTLLEILKNKNNLI